MGAGPIRRWSRSAASEFAVYPVSREAPEVAWVPADRVESLDLHPGFAETWPVIRAALDPVTVIVDGANVMGSRADGWWRDRAGAAARLYGELAALAGRGVAALPADLGAAGLDRWFPEYILVVEGQAKAAVPALREVEGVRVVAAPGSGDDTIAELAATASRTPAGGHRRPGTAPPVGGRGRGRDRPPVASGAL